MSAIRVVIAVAGAALTAARHPVVRAGMQAVVANPKARDAAIGAVMSGAYTAGRLARFVMPVSRKLP